MISSQHITESNIRKALDNNEFVAYYQPQYSANNNKLCSAEALVRWIQPDGTIVPPMDFIPIAEQSELVRDIDHFMLSEVCSMLRERIDAGLRPINVSVNFSRRHLLADDFRESLCGIVDSYSIPRKLITVELTESAIMENPINLTELITEIRNDGFDVAVDDFGSGLSSLSLIKDIPANVLKIDRSLLSGNCESEKQRILLESIFDFAHRLKLTTVAEGVETVSQLGFLRTCDCRMIQGYYFAKPMPREEFEQMYDNTEEFEETEDILLTQTPSSVTRLLMDAIFIRYPLVIVANLSRNSYYMMAYENFTAHKCPSTGIFDELIKGGASTMHPEDRELFSTAFAIPALMDAYNRGEKCVSITTRQLGDDGVYRRVETSDYFVKNPASEDVLIIALCHNLD